jgi:hypothetical protein
LKQKIKIIVLILGAALGVYALLIFTSKSFWHEIIADRNKMERSGKSSISADGRFIAFSSTDTRLPGGNNDKQNIYVYDNETGNINQASTNSKGNAANGSSSLMGPSTSADGSTVVFYSKSSNLIEGAEKGLFKKDLSTGEVKAILVSDDDSPRIDNFVMDYSVSRSGRFVVYESRNGVFVYDSDLNVTTRADVDISGNEIPDFHPGDNIGTPSISADGRFVAFMLSKKLVNKKSVDRDTQIDIYIKDRQTGQITLASVDAKGQPLDYSIRPCLTVDGGLLVFENDNTVQLHEVETGKTVQLDNGTQPTISPNGRYLTYEKRGDDNTARVNCAANKNCSNLFVKDMQTGQTIPEIIPLNWNNWSRMDSLGISDNGVLAFSSSGSFEGIEPEKCKVHIQQDEASQLVDVYCASVYRKDLSSGNLVRIGDQK